MPEKIGVAALQRAQEARERQRAEATTEDDYLQDAILKKPAASSERLSRPAKSAPAPKDGASDRVHTSVYLPRDLRRRLREIAASEDCKMHDLTLEGVRHVVNRRATSA